MIGGATQNVRTITRRKTDEVVSLSLYWATGETVEIRPVDLFLVLQWRQCVIYTGAFPMSSPR